MIKLLNKVINSVIGFTFYFLCWVYLFGIFYNLMGITFGDDDYQNLDKFAIILITSFRMSVADISIPDYSLWSGQTENFPLSANVMVYMTYVVWFIHTYLMAIIMLNFLVAFVS